MYNGYPNRISNEQLRLQLDMLELAKAKRRAALALDLNSDYPSMVNPEMKVRVWWAMKYIDLCADHDYEDRVAETQELRVG